MFLTFPVDSTSWYKPGQTPGSVLGEVSSSMEECRAETVALYCESNSELGALRLYGRHLGSAVVSNLDILKIFNVSAMLRRVSLFVHLLTRSLEVHGQARYR